MSTKWSCYFDDGPMISDRRYWFHWKGSSSSSVQVSSCRLRGTLFGPLSPEDSVALQPVALARRATRSARSAYSLAHAARQTVWRRLYGASVFGQYKQGENIHFGPICRPTLAGKRRSIGLHSFGPTRRPNRRRQLAGDAFQWAASGGRLRRVIILAKLVH